MSSSHPELLPGGYPVTPQREENRENIAEYDQATGYNQPTPEHGKVAENITNNSPITSEYGNAAGENLENRKLDNNHDNSEYNFRNRKPEDDWENKRPENDLENKRPEDEGVWENKKPNDDLENKRPEDEGVWENRKPNDDLENGDLENRKPVGDWENRKPNDDLENGDWENRKPNDDLENRKPEGDWENKKLNDDWENKKPNDDWENKKPNDDWENKKPNDDLENRKPEDDWENRKPNDDLENRKPEGDWENRKLEDNSKNRQPESENPEKSKDDKIREDFPLRFEPNSSSMQPNDKNDLAKVTNHGSSALGGIGINPAALFGGGDKSPRHPYFEQKEKEISGKEKEAVGGDKGAVEGDKEAAEGDKGAAEGEVDNSSTIKPSNIAGQKTHDLTGDYKEHEANVAQEQDKDKPSETHPQKQKSEIKKPDRIDLGVKPLGGQQLPLPYKPEESAGNMDRAHQPQGKTTEVYPEGPNVGAKVTKKDKLNATINKAVGTFKQKIGKLTKNDNLISKGTEKKAEAERTKEFGGMRKEI